MLKRLFKLIKGKFQLYPKKLKPVKANFNEYEMELPEQNVHPLMEKFEQNGSLSLPDINMLISDVYDCKSVNDNFYRLQPSIFEDALFELTSITVETVGDKKVLYLNWVEVTYNIRMSITVHPEDLHDIFKPHVIKIPKETKQ